MVTNLPIIPAHVDIHLNGIEDENEKFTLSMSPDEAAKIGERLIELGKQYAEKLAKAQATGSLLD